MSTHGESESGRSTAAGGDGRDHPGRRFGYPESGPGSIAGLGIRVVALAIDWALSLLISSALWGFRLGSGADGASFKPLVVFLVMNVLLVATAGSTIGHRLMGLQVQRAGGGYAGPLPAVIRSVLLCLAIPPLLWDADERGLHDRAAGTVLRRVR